MRNDTGEIGDRLPIDWGVEDAVLAGEPESGDRFVVQSFDGGVLVAVIDGIGHGREAASAAEAAVSVLKPHASEPLELLVNRCHERLQKTRGAVMAVAAFHAKDDTMTWIGVGNVNAVLHRVKSGSIPLREHLLMNGGVVGDRLPALRPFRVPVALGDTLVLATDGIAEDFARDPALIESPARVAQKILNHHAKRTDDALVLVARYTGTRQ